MKTSFGFAFLLGLSSFSTTMITAQPAHAWNKLVECDNGNFVIDGGEIDESGRPRYQMVLRGAPLNYFVQQGAIRADRINNKGEYVSVIFKEEQSFMTFAGITPGLQMKYRIYRNYGSYVLDAYIDNRIGVDASKYGVGSADWKFNNCIGY